jgi:hypothetical protein
MAHRLGLTVQEGGDGRSRPVGAVGLHVEQDGGLLPLKGRSRAALGQLAEGVPFVVCEAHTIGLGHGESSIPHQAG